MKVKHQAAGKQIEAEIGQDADDFTPSWWFRVVKSTHEIDEREGRGFPTKAAVVAAVLSAGGFFWILATL